MNLIRIAAKLALTSALGVTSAVGAGLYARVELAGLDWRMSAAKLEQVAGVTAQWFGQATVNNGNWSAGFSSDVSGEADAGLGAGSTGGLQADASLLAESKVEDTDFEAYGSPHAHMQVGSGGAGSGDENATANAEVEAEVEPAGGAALPGLPHLDVSVDAGLGFGLGGD